jgi:hypothetical protein
MIDNEYTPNYFFNKIEWDSTVVLSDTKHRINLFRKNRDSLDSANEEFTAKEWIAFEIYLCKKLVENNEYLVKTKKDELLKSTKELKKTIKVFDDYIITNDDERERKDDFFFFSVNYKNLTKDFTKNIQKTKIIIEDFLKYQEMQIKELGNKQTIIKAICRNSIKYILQKEKETIMKINPKFNFLVITNDLMNINNIGVSKNIPNPEQKFNRTSNMVRFK